MSTHDALQAINQYHKPYATSDGPYELVFEPHLLGSMVHVTARKKDERVGTWLLCDAPADFVVALGRAALKLSALE